jgi:hypothetical protein
VVKYRKIPPAAAANQIAENARIPPAADLQKNNSSYFLLGFDQRSRTFFFNTCMKKMLDFDQ